LCSSVRVKKRKRAKKTSKHVVFMVLERESKTCVREKARLVEEKRREKTSCVLVSRLNRMVL
jgi:hypothetical protein